jgi:xanthine dehydrogenase YagR molybdenum-binding subunit
VFAVDAGRILSRKLARTQIVGGAIMAIGMRMCEDTAFDGTGRIANAIFSDHQIPANADVPDIDFVVVGTPGPRYAHRHQGMGEISGSGLSAAIANAYTTQLADYQIIADHR